METWRLARLTPFLSLLLDGGLILGQSCPRGSLWTPFYALRNLSRKVREQFSLWRDLHWMWLPLKPLTLVVSMNCLWPTWELQGGEQ